MHETRTHTSKWFGTTTLSQNTVGVGNDPFGSPLLNPTKASSLDEALSESEASASGACSEDGLLVRSQLLLLAENICRAPSWVEDRSGSRVTAAGGVLAQDCRKYAMKRIGPKAYQYPTGFYHPVHASCGSRSCHGLVKKSGLLSIFTYSIIFNHIQYSIV
jgi:hypothetical protein